MRLKNLAGWNQTIADWRRLLRLNPSGCFAALADEKVVATITTTEYEDELAWIGMVLVEPSFRRRGIATRLMEAALEYLKEKQVRAVKLDATPEGQLVYEGLGFEFELMVERWSRAGDAVNTTSDRAPDAADSALGSVLELDRRAFGADRSQLLRLLIDDSTGGLRSRRKIGENSSGYALARPGTAADYIGPIVADDPQTALALLDDMLGRATNAQVLIDINTTFGVAPAELKSRGFVKQRDLIRMRRGEESGAGTSDLIFAIAGPEVG